jgi:hypothetical protein
MRMLIALLVLVVLTGLIMWQYKADVRVLEKHHEKIQQVSSSPQESDQQRDCTEQAFARYKGLGLESNKSASYKGHFSTGLNQCYELIESTDASLDTLWKRVTLYEADGKVFGSYAWHSAPDQKPADIPPFNCDVQMPTGEHKSCSSETEFRFLADTYMK